MFGESEDAVGEPWMAATALWPDHFSYKRRMENRSVSFFEWMEDWIDNAMDETP
ncbi:hypothetical protein OCOJLMKI_4196 [Methylobacterium iners]|uniref:Uncharacterized protein n=2 Tax=Methylobacterium iners TaxID=418707 RepID=A0ABQ4S1H4_9HYPH|nr:hypothetical protein OCOJLMKI_4196 [Methylobacterium iners]